MEIIPLVSHGKMLKRSPTTKTYQIHYFEGDVDLPGIATTTKRSKTLM